MKIIGERTYNFSAILIHIGMFLFQLFHLEIPRRYPNHFVIEKDGENIEAVWPRVHRIPKREYAKARWEWVVPDSDYPEKQVGKRYEAMNFLWHTVKILLVWLHLWFGSLSAKQHSCVELMTRTMKAKGYRINIFLNPVEFTRWMNKRYNVKRFG